MTTFSFSTGNPSNLTGGATASMTDISGSFTDLKTFVNGSITDTNVTAGALTYASLNSTVDSNYETLCEGVGLFNTAVTGSGGSDTFVLPTSNSPIRPGDGGAYGARYLDPARYPAGSRSGKLSLAVAAMVNGTAPGITITVGLYPVTAAGGGASVCTITLSAAIAASTVAFASPTANSLNHSETADFTFPAAGFYALGFGTSAGLAANSAVAIRARLEYRKV